MMRKYEENTLINARYDEKFQCLLLALLFYIFFLCFVCEIAGLLSQREVGHLMLFGLSCEHTHK